MAKLRPPIEWAPPSSNTWNRFGMRERADNKWEVVTSASWWKDDWRVDVHDVKMVVDSRDAAIGFIKLLRGE